jgi:peptidoglycan/LPS O-acetylase OafA/YrhL
MLVSIVALWKHYSLACSTIGFTFLNLSFASLAAAAAGGSGLLANVRVVGAKYLAAISYSVYLTHSLALELSARLLGNWHIATGSWKALGITASAIFLFAVCLYYLVERPALLFRDRVLRGVQVRPRPQKAIPMPEPAPAQSAVSQ